MNYIYEYQLPYKVKEEVTKVQENGDKVITVEEVEKKIKVAIKEPTRADIEKAKNIYQETWSDCVRRGILTRAIIDKNYRGQNGILTDPEVKALEEIQNRLGEIHTEYREIDKKEVKTEEDKTKLNDLITEFAIVQDQITALENINEGLYRNTAESIALEKQILWNIISLTYVENGGKLLPIVLGDTLNEKLDNLDKILEDKSSEESKNRAALYGQIIDRNGYFINQLSRGKITDAQIPDLNAAIEKGELIIN